MTQGFYEQIGVRTDAELDEIKAAYGRAVAHIMRRREAAVAQGGDPSSLDSARAQLDDAWDVLSDPVRRRKYDALLALAESGSSPQSKVEDWPQVAGAIIHPSILAAAQLVSALTELKLGDLPTPPKPGGRQPVVNIESAEERTRGQAAFGGRRQGRTSPGTMPNVVGLPTAGGRPTASPRTSPGQVLGFSPNTQGPRSTAAGTHGGAMTDAGAAAPPKSSAVVDLLQQHGYSGAYLKAVRERRGVSLSKLSEVTRISVRFLEAVEVEDFAALPSAAAFVRGYVREMARQLDLDVERVVNGYMRRFANQG